MLRNKLIKFGLSTNESDVYITIAQNKDIKAGEIIKILNINRALVYRALESLISNNIISEFKNKGGKTYNANDPISFLTNANDKVTLAQEIELEIKSLIQIPNLQNDVMMFRGEKAIIDFMNLVVETKQTWYILGAVWGMRKPEFNDHIELLKNKLRKSKTKTKVIAKHGLEGLSWTPQELTTTRVLPEDFANSPIVVHIFGDYVCHTIWEKPETVIVIKNKVIALDYKKYFDLIWEKSLDL
jgi:sugar-specific transcriptional regulator TrmB